MVSRESPARLAHILLLDGVPSGRAIIGVGLGGILIMALFCAAEFEPGHLAHSTPGRFRPLGSTERRRQLRTGALVCAGVAFGLYFWAGRGLMATYPMSGISLWKAGIVSAAVAVVVFLLCARKVILGGVALVVFAASISLTVNPLYRGLGPLTSSPLLATLQRTRRSLLTQPTACGSASPALMSMTC